MDSKRTGDYHVTFISRHLNDNDPCDEKARWWSLWHEYRNDKNDIPIYGDLMLCGPKRKSDSNKYILLTDSVHLTGPLFYLLDPFHFDSHSDVITTNQYGALTHWEYIFTVYNTLDIVSSILSTLSDVKLSNKKRKSRK